MVFFANVAQEEIEHPDVPPQQQVAAAAATRLEQLCALNVLSATSAYRLTGIICTIGPSSRDPDMLVELMKSGMNIALVNLSYENHDYHEETIKNIKSAAEKYSESIERFYPIGIAVDLKGSEIRTGILADKQEEVELAAGSSVKVTTEDMWCKKGSAELVYLDCGDISCSMKKGNRIFLDQGNISLICDSVDGNNFMCTVENGGVLGNQKRASLPGVQLTGPVISDKDRRDLKFAVEQGADIVLAPYVASGSAVEEIRKGLGSLGKKILVIAKIETQQGVDNFDEILAAADGILVARRDLGLNITSQKVFLVQKSIIAKCNRAGKPVICATQMLDTMAAKPRPTRAEGTDVANAILDGTDCVMLTGSTATGEYPVKCLQTLVNLCREAEAMYWHKQAFGDLSESLPLPADNIQTVALAAVEASHKTNASAIIVLTTSGKSTHLISKYKPKCPIIAVTRHHQTARQVHLFRAVCPIIYENGKTDDYFKEIEAKAQAGIAYGKTMDFIKTGDTVIIVSPWSPNAGIPNTMRIVYVTQELENICVGTCND